MDNRIVLTGTIQYVDKRKTLKGAEFFNVRILHTDKFYRINGKVIELPEHQLWITMYVNKVGKTSEAMKALDIKGKFLTIRNCQLSRYKNDPSKGHVTDRFGIKLNSHDAFVSETSVPTLNAAILSGYLRNTHPDTGADLMLDGKPVSWLCTEKEEVPIVNGDSGFRPTEGHTLVVGSMYAKSPDGITSPHIVPSAIIKC